jgi:cytoskeletal protein CcmA (bactofilin family)
VSGTENLPVGPAMDHIDEMTCLLYIERQLDRARAQEVSAHAQECGPCRTLLRAMERESRLLTRAMLEEDEALPARLAQFQERARRSMQWIWGLAFGLAATGVYALYTGYVEPWQQQLEQAGFGGSDLLSLLIFQGAFWKGWQSMITLLEVLALLVVGGFGFAFFRRRVRRGSALALVLTGFCALATLALPATAGATEFRRADTTEVPAGETIKGDLFLFSHHARIDGTVDGDVYLFAQDASVSGHVNGYVIGFVQSLRVNGKVDGNIRAFANNVTVTGEVSRNVLIFAELMNLDATGKITGSMTAFLQSLHLDGHLGRDLLLFCGDANIAGKIDGGIHAKGANLSIRSTAEVAGPVRFEGDNQPDVSPQAKLASPVDYHKMEHRPRYREGGYYIWQVIWAAAFVLFGLVLFQLMPKFSKEATDNVDRAGASFGLGVLVFFSVPIAAIIACVTIVGLFIGASSFFVWYAALYYAQIVVGAAVGQWMMDKTNEAWPLIGRMTVGVVLVRLCTTVPHVGGWVKFGVILWGVGALSLALYNRFQTPGSQTAPMVPISHPPNTTIGGVQPA